MFNDLYRKEPIARTRWASPENPLGLKGGGGTENKGSKGRPSKPVDPGETLVLMDVAGSGIVNRIWMTTSDRSEKTLRSLKLEMYWDDSPAPAVSAPLGDFFCNGLSILTPFENYLFSNPEGKSFNCFVPMPFLTAARITITNESDTRLNNVFYDINYTLTKLDENEILYFHCFWNRENPAILGRDYTFLDVKGGGGRLLGVCFGVNTNKACGETWFGEGEVKIYTDGDGEYPTLCGTGTEDFIGTAWGQGRYANMTQGCTVASEGRFAFYRLHLHDPVYFREEIRAEIQVMGGAFKGQILEALKRGAPIEIVTHAPDNGEIIPLCGTDFVLTEDSPDGWYNFRRRDDYSSAAYFYFDKPGATLPPIAEAEKRV